jgi:FkbM family methyltransferase
LTILKNIINNPRVSIDVGANDGIYTYALSKISIKVESFEPQVDCLDLLYSYNAKNVNIHNCGLSNINGLLKLNIPVVGGKARRGYASFKNKTKSDVEIIVPIRRLDDFNFESIDFIKIDVEGYEKEVIEGAVNTIKNNSPIILIEIEQRHLSSVNIHDVFQLIKNLNYQGFFYLNKLRYPISEFQLDKHQNYQNKNIYINNFIFLPNGFNQ